LKKVIAFDLDDTLAASKTALTDEMSDLLGQLLKKFIVAVTSGGKIEQFEEQLLGNLKIDSSLLNNLHLLPTCGTRYYRWNEDSGKWNMQYAEDFKPEEKKKIISALEKGAKELGLWEKDTWGEIIEDRNSQITFSALGQRAPVKEKEKWDPNSSKKRKLRDLVAPQLPEFEVRVGGKTSIDITRLGVDKAYGMNKLMDALGVEKKDILFIGDRLEEGENDYPVKAMGIDTIAVDGYRETPLVVEALVKV